MKSLKFKTIWKNLKRPFKNMFLLIGMGFLIWMLFFDANSWLIHKELNKEIYQLEEKKSFYRDAIQTDQEEWRELQTDEGLEEYGREHFFLKQPNEDIFIIEFQDSINKKS